MKKAKKIVVEAIIPCNVETLWERSQNPDLHILWDMRFSHIKYLDERDAKGFRLMDYRTKIAFGVEIETTIGLLSAATFPIASETQ